MESHIYQMEEKAYQRPVTSSEMRCSSSDDRTRLHDHGMAQLKLLATAATLCVHLGTLRMPRKHSADMDIPHGLNESEQERW